MRRYPTMEILTLINEIIKQIRELFNILTSKPNTSIDEIETKIHKVMIEIGRQLTQAIINSHGTGYTHRAVKTPSGEQAIFKGYQNRTIGTLMGKITIKRAYYNKGKAKGSYFPLDESLSIPSERYTYAAQEAIGLFAIEDSFGESAKKLKYLFPITASPSTIRRISQKHGKEITDDEAIKVQEIFSHKRPVPEPRIDTVKRGYTGTDGVMVPTLNGYREMKVAATYDTPIAKDSLANHLHYMSLFAKPEDFGEHLWVMQKEQGIYDGDESIWVSDGAKWEWKQKRYHDPDGKEILDFIHAVEHLSDVATEIYGESTDRSKNWLKRMKKNLRKEGGNKVLNSLNRLSKSHRGEKLKSTIEYYRNNVNRMDYPRYESEWYHITSSTVESACRHVVGDRLKRSGMRWTEDGAQYITSLRLKWKNDEWKSFWSEYRAIN